MIGRLIVAIALGTVALNSSGQSTQVSQKAESPLLDPKQSCVYMRFSKTGTGSPFLEGEIRERIWLILKNNTHWPVSVRTFGPPDEYGDDEAGLMHEVEKYGLATPDGAIPHGYSFDVASLTELQPGEELLFSVPKNHLDPGLAIRVDFGFGWEMNGHYTRHSSYFSYWDLPDNLRDKEKERKLSRAIGQIVGGGAEYYVSPRPQVLSTPTSRKQQ